jgi:putative membrane protein insertion efficiency factor
MTSPVPAMAPLSGRRSPMAYLLIGFLKAYRLVISPLYGNVCRYYPSCSAYALTAVQLHGAARGSWLATKRLARCHPWARGGYDPVPGADQGDQHTDSAETVGTMEKQAHVVPAPSDEPAQPEQSDRHAAGRGNGVN